LQTTGISYCGTCFTLLKTRAFADLLPIYCRSIADLLPIYFRSYDSAAVPA